MHPNFYRNSPFRPPDWRSNRVLELVTSDSRPLPPQWYDDGYVRTYRRFLFNQLAAGVDETRRMAVFLENPYVYQAHLLRYDYDPQWRQILEARLLTNESFARIAARFSTAEPTIDFYEKLFFNVRDRMQHSDWIAKLILGSPGSRTPGRDGALSEGQRGFVFRFFGYHGGPLVLDAVINGLTAMERPLRVDEVGDWLAQAQRSILQTQALVAAKVFEVNRTNVMKVLKLALRSQQATRATKSRTPAPQTASEQQAYLERVMATFHWQLAQTEQSGFAVHDPTTSSAAAKSSADEQPTSTAGQLPVGLAEDVRCQSAGRVRQKNKAATKTTKVKSRAIATTTAVAHDTKMVPSDAEAQSSNALSDAEVQSWAAFCLTEG